MKIDLAGMESGAGMARPTFSMLLLLVMGDNPDKQMQGYDSLMAIASYLDTGSPIQCPHGFWDLTTEEVKQ